MKPLHPILKAPFVRKGGGNRHHSLTSIWAEHGLITGLVAVSESRAEVYLSSAARRSGEQTLIIVD